MDDRELAIRLHELRAQGPSATPEIHALVKAEGGWQRIISLIPVPGSKKQRALSVAASALKRKSKRSLPEHFPLQADLDWAQTYWLAKGRADLCTLASDEASKFRDYHTSNATTSADWSASWRTWAKNAMRFGPQPRQNGHDPRPVAKIISLSEKVST